MNYTVTIKRSALKVLKTLPPSIQDRIQTKINLLSRSSRPPGTVKLSNEEEIYRIRVGRFRIVYKVQDKILIITIIKIDQRKNVYRNL